MDMNSNVYVYIVRVHCTCTLYLYVDEVLLHCCQVLELDLSTVVPSLSGPKRPHDRVAVTDMKSDFLQCLQNKVWPESNVYMLFSHLPFFYAHIFCSLLFLCSKVPIILLVCSKNSQHKWNLSCFIVSGKGSVY